MTHPQHPCNLSSCPFASSFSATSSAGPGGRSCIRNSRSSSANGRWIWSSPTPRTSPAEAGSRRTCFNKLRSYGVDVITLGDHIYKKHRHRPDAAEQRARRASREPLAAPRAAVHGRDHQLRRARSCVFSRARADLHEPARRRSRSPRPIACWPDLPTNVRVCVCDVHAEATSEKVAMGHYLDGRVSFIVGTHTHIPTADAKILPGGSAYITDLGMCGPYDSVLGRRKDRVLKYMTTNMPAPFDVATGDVRMCGVLARSTGDRSGDSRSSASKSKDEQLRAGLRRRRQGAANQSRESITSSSPINSKGRSRIDTNSHESARTICLDSFVSIRGNSCRFVIYPCMAGATSSSTPTESARSVKDVLRGSERRIGGVFGAENLAGELGQIAQLGICGS